MLTIKEIIQLLPLLQSLNFALLLLATRNSNSKANKILGIYMLINFLQYFLQAFDIFRLYDMTIITYYLIMPFMLSSVPFLYFYIKSLTVENYRFGYKELVHFIPSFIILILNIFSFGGISYNDKILIIKGLYKSSDPHLTFFLTTYKLSNLIYNVQIIFYSGLMIFLLMKHKSNIKQQFSYKENISLNWLTVFITVFVCFSIFELTVYYTKFISLSEIYYSLIIVSFLTFLGFFGIKQSDIYTSTIQFYKKQQTRTLSITGSKLLPHSGANKEPVNIKKEIIRPVLINEATAIGLANNDINKINSDNTTLLHEFTEEKNLKKNFILSEQQTANIIQNLNELMETEKPYLNSRLTLSDLAGALHINRNYLSQIINIHFNKNFITFINEFRVKKAQELLVDSEYDKFSIDGIAAETGFNSRSSFYSAFKKHTGITPSEYKKHKEKTV
ncbi:MAG: AraC family transcriptional regulator [Bacteroidia bacterium]|nr:AraC family transcriptional regulator [Bacteroidia bacterium]